MPIYASDWWDAVKEKNDEGRQHDQNAQQQQSQANQCASCGDKGGQQQHQQKADQQRDNAKQDFDKAARGAEQFNQNDRLMQSSLSAQGTSLPGNHDTGTNGLHGLDKDKPSSSVGPDSEVGTIFGYSAPDTQFGAYEIGRASCRERV